ncbi:hypothetical protein [Candidatus Ichthyocystis hellenicum]|uniref:hypothetical protein n=1 Tax=Candidatus Ichthyocystis hellenicum TaxID=1561003 RepID=UPI000B84F208|nr:hypothetical protein [Candidatus Ichthyocystis hellenicum]
MDADSTDIFSSARRCSYCSDSGDDCPAYKGGDELGLQVLFQTPTSSTGSLCCLDESGNNESDSEVNHDSDYEEYCVPPRVAVNREEIDRIVRKLRRTHISDSVKKIIKILIIVSILCLLCSIITFLCALGDKNCLIPASCLLTVGVVCFILASVLRRRGSLPCCVTEQ